MVGYIIKYPGCVMDEVMPTIRSLKDKTELKVIDLHSVSSQLSPDFLVIPGGSCDEAVVHKELHLLIQNAVSKNRIVAGICNGAVVIASAGAMKDKRCTHTAHPKYASLPEFKELLEFAKKVFADSVYVDEQVVIDGNTITAKPNASEEFARTIATRLGF